MPNDYITTELPSGAVVTEIAPPPAAAYPVLSITGIVADSAHAAQTVVSADLDDVTCPVGTVLTVTAELRAPGGGPVIPITEAFRMPLRARDGREEVLLARMDAGIVTITAPMDQSGVWRVTDQTINESLPPAMQMAFGGLTLYVVK